jgi:nicotinate-nucleotide pyrophosphorylase
VHLQAHVVAAAGGWLAEDLGHECDWTSVSLIPPDAWSELRVVSRTAGVIALDPAVDERGHILSRWGVRVNVALDDLRAST